jgi:hypothetical protein
VAGNPGTSLPARKASISAGRNGAEAGMLKTLSLATGIA